MQSPSSSGAAAKAAAVAVLITVEDTAELIRVSQQEVSLRCVTLRYRMEFDQGEPARSIG